jgi:hypothetical protein
MVKKKFKWVCLLLLLSLTTLTCCQSTPSPREPISARALAREYERSTAAMRSKYDGKEITVRGNALTTPTLPPDRANEGSVLLEENDVDSHRQVTCWFSQTQSEAFSHIKPGQIITVKGVFNGEAGVDLKFCKLVNIE